MTITIEYTGPAPIHRYFPHLTEEIPLIPAFIGIISLTALIGCLVSGGAALWILAIFGVVGVGGIVMHSTCINKIKESMIKKASAEVDERIAAQHPNQARLFVPPQASNPSQVTTGNVQGKQDPRIALLAADHQQRGYRT